MLVVADSSPLMALAAADALDVLEGVFQLVRIPPAVEAELLISGKPHADELRSFVHGRTLHVDLRNYIVTGPGLGRGELEAMALFKATGAERLLIDDLRARKVATINGIKVVGSAGVLLLAKDSGLIDSIRPRLEAMQSAGIHLSQSLVEDALRIAGEWP